MNIDSNKLDNSNVSNPWKGFQQVDEGGDIYQQIFKYSKLPTIVHDMDMNIIEANDSAIKEFGFTKNEFLNKRIFDLHTKDELEHSAEVLEQMKQKNKLSAETRFMRKDGSIFMAEVTPCKYMVGDKPIIHVHIQNITERKQAEKKLQEVNTALQVEMAKVELNAREIEIKNKELEEFAYVAAHDLKAPITNLNVLKDMINLDGMVNSKDIQLFNKLKNNIEQVKKTVFILNDVINFKTTLRDKKERLKFENVFKEIEESISEQFKESNTTIDVDFSECSIIHYPPLHLKSIMQNLLTNSLKYRNPNKVLKIKVKTREVNGRVCLTVEDNGLGFDGEKYSKKVFRLFKRLHTHVEGKGVGMYIVNSIVEAHGGKIEVKSMPKEGAMFSIYLNKGKNE